MPTIYRIRCTSCGQSQEVSGGVGGWVTTDGRQDGKILPEGYLALKLDTGEFLCLPHPVENSTLEENGFTWAGASRQGRLFRVTFKICEQCGRMHEERQIHDSRSACLAALISAPLAIVALKFGAKHSWALSLVVGYLVMMGVLGLVAVINWMRWRKANAELQLGNCERCKGTAFVTLSKAAGRLLTCPSCNTRNLHVGVAGMS